MTRYAHLVGYFRDGLLVDAGVYSEPFPTVINAQRGKPKVLATVSGRDFHEASTKAGRLLGIVRQMMAAAPARHR